MKKVVFLLFLFTIIFSFSISQAKTGDIIGYVYSTDIMTYINGVEVPSCNIGGQTAIPIEMVTEACTYDDSMRTLIINDFNPANFKNAENPTYSKPVGTKIAYIYETDIDVFMYDKEIPSYNIGGITCVTVEDLGLDNAFSDIGGKFIWDPIDRTINLEFIYKTNPEELLKNYNIKIVDGDLSFTRDLEAYNGVSVQFKKESLKNAKQLIIPVYYNGQTHVGYVLKTPTLLHYVNALGNGYFAESSTIIPYLYEEKLENLLEEGISSASIKSYNLSMGDIVDMHLDKWLGTIKDRYTGDSYLFLLISQETVRGENDLLLYIRTDGTCEYIHELLPNTYSGVRSITNFKKDTINETVTFGLRGVNTKYRFDLKNCELTEI